MREDCIDSDESRLWLFFLLFSSINESEECNCDIYQYSRWRELITLYVNKFVLILILFVKNDQFHEYIIV